MKQNQHWINQMNQHKCPFVDVRVLTYFILTRSTWELVINFLRLNEAWLSTYVPGKYVVVVCFIIVTATTYQVINIKMILTAFPQYWAAGRGIVRNGARWWNSVNKGSKILRILLMQIGK